MRIAIDLIWVKVGKVGGVESYIRNLLDGIFEIDSKNEYFLITTKDNDSSFRKYAKNENCRIIVANVMSEPVIKRIIWQNVFFEKLLRENLINSCFCPVYLKPVLSNGKIKYITAIHDLQHLHYPENFSKKRYYWTINAWKINIRTSSKIVAISEFVKNDILSNFRVDESKIQVIYNPIVVDNGMCPFEDLERKYGIQKNKYFFALSALLKHKNLDTLIEIIKKICSERIDGIPNKLVISGVNGDARHDIENKIREYGLDNNITLTGFISNEERNTLYQNCYAFLFPSVFEGFGMPVIEGLMLGAKVITTKETSIMEVSKGNALYVENPYDVNQWIQEIIKSSRIQARQYSFDCYNRKIIAQKYIDLFSDVFI